MLDLVIFDADGVLFDSTDSNTAYYNKIFDLVGEAAMSLEEEKAGVFLSAPQIFELRASGDAERIARMREVARTLDSTPFFKMLRPHPNLRELLLTIKRDYRLGLATNRSATIPAIIDYLGLSGVFDAVASARDAVRPKPAPDMLHLCLERAGVEAHRAVYVGDSATDLEAASAAGIHFVGLGPRAPHVHQIGHLENLSLKLKEIFG